MVHPTDTRDPSKDRPLLVGALVAAGLLVVMVLWFGRAGFGGWWVAPGPTSDDTYMLSTIYERWAVQVKGGHLPLWFPEFGAGYPVHAAWMYGLFYPPIALFLVLPPEAAWTWLAILHVVFGGLGMYAFLWDDRRDAAAAACGAVVFALSGFMLQRILAGHMNLVIPTAWAPWVLLAAARTARGEPRAAAWLGLAAGFGLLAGHAQIWFYVAPLVAAFAVMEAARRRRIRAAAPALLVAAAIALGVSAIQWLPAQELDSLTRSPAERRGVVESCSAPVASLVAQVAPRFASPPADGLAHEFVGLAGPLAVLAALLAFRLRDGRRWFWFAALVVGLVLATGLRTELGRIANELPPFRLARAPGRAMTLVVIAGSVLAAQLVADWLGALPTKMRALAPPAFVASALLFGSPGPDVVKRDFYEFDWTQTTPDARNHRIHVGSGRYPYVERFGARTLRSVCPAEQPEFAEMTPPKTRPDVAAWWFDVGLEIDAPSDAARGDLRALAAQVRRHESTPGGAIQTFAEAVCIPDGDAWMRLAAGERSLFLAAESRQETWRATDAAALARVRVEPTDAPDRVVLAADAPCAGPVFVSQRWYPGWEVAPPSRVARGNVGFLAVYADFRAPGTVEIRYRPWWRVPALVAGAASLALAAWLVVRRAPGASTFSRTDGAS
jgi:hypothetical protein